MITNDVTGCLEKNGTLLKNIKLERCF